MAADAGHLHLFEDEQFEHERYWWDSRQWSAQRFMPLDPPHLTPVQSRRLAEEERRVGNDVAMAVELLGAAERGAEGEGGQVLVFTTPWHAAVDADTDADGWQYAFDFSQFTARVIKPAPRMRLNDWVRRRALRRRRLVVSASQVQAASAPAAAAAAAAAAADAPLTVIIANRTDAALLLTLYTAAREGVHYRRAWDVATLRVAAPGAAEASAAVSLDERGCVRLEFGETLHARGLVGAAPPFAAVVISLACESPPPDALTEAELLARPHPRFERALLRGAALEHAVCWIGTDQLAVFARGEMRVAERAEEVRLSDRASLGAHACYRHSRETARVRLLGNISSVCEEEERFTRERLARCRHAIERFAGVAIASDDETPRIGLCFSGGGVRALLNALGCAEAAQSMGLLDCVAFSGGVSGGAWFQALWAQSQLPLLDPDAEAKGGSAAAAAAAACRDEEDEDEGSGAGDEAEFDPETPASTSSTQPQPQPQPRVALRGGEVRSLEALLRARLADQPFVRSHKVARAVYAAVKRQSAFKPRGEAAVSDVYGNLLGFRWLREHGDDRLLCHLSQQEALCRALARPLPLYAAVRPVLRGGSGGGGGGGGECEYEWWEFSPFETTALDWRLAVPSWAFGRRFRAGVSATSGPEQPTALLMGMFGSAFAASVAEVDRTLGLPAPLMSAMRRLGFDAHRFVAPTSNFSPARGFAAAVPNRDRQARDEVSWRGGDGGGGSGGGGGGGSEDFSQLETVELVDAGVYVNAPLPSMTRRRCDLIIVCDARPTEASPDASKDVLQAFARYAERHGMRRVPPLNRTLNAGAVPMLVFEDPTRPGPVLVYLGLVKNPDFDPAFDPASSGFADFRNFSYRPEHSAKVAGLARFNALSQRGALQEIVRRVALAKRKPPS
jgi:phospholipase A2